MKEKLLLAAAALLGFATACNNEEDQPKVVSMYGVPYNNYKIKGKVTDKAGRPIKGIEVRSNAYLPTPEATTAADGTYDLSGKGVGNTARVTLTDTDGNSFSVGKTEPVTLEAGGKHDTDDARSSFVTELVFCGDNMVYMIDAGLANETTYKDAVTWSWDATEAAAVLGLDKSRCNHLDDCKPVDNGKKLLCTSSYNWCVLLDIATKEVLFHTTATPNAHSAELLPGNRIVVACSGGESSGNNSIQLYDISQPNRILYQSALGSAHGVVWNETTQRLYAIGGQSLQIYKLKDWETAAPSLELEKTVQTPQGGLHDMSYVNSNTLCIGGRRAYLYDIGANRFTEMMLFSASTAIKSINYNDETGELWYTDSTNPEGSQSWSTQTIRYSTDKNASTETRTIKVPDLDVYKVRVMNW